MAIQICLAQDFDVEKLLDSEELDEDQTLLIEYLELLNQSPLNVNTASAKELSTLPWISPIVAVRIIQYRHQYGVFKRLEDIQNVRGVKPVYDKISPFLTTGKQKVSPQVHAHGRHRLLSRFENSKAFQENLYAGSKEKMYNRIKCDVGEFLHAGVLMEKDSGEKKWNDLSLGHLVLNPGYSTTIIVGDFAAEFGQGLGLSGPYNMFKGGDPVAPAKQRSRGLTPYLSTVENYAFRGIAVSAHFTRLDFHAFTSRQKRDARLVDGAVQSMPETGLHRTDAECAARDKLLEQVSGFVVEAHVGKVGHIGGLWQRAVYDQTFPKGEAADYYDFYGDNNQVVGLNFDLSFGSLNTFGELTQSTSGGRAVLAGAWYDLAPIELVAVGRRYDIDFHNRFALGFGERPDTRNENGFYFGIRYRLNSQTTLCYYVDQWKSPWLHTFVPMPSSGFDLLFSIDYKASSFLLLSSQIRYEQKDAGSSSEDQFGNPVRIVERPQRSKIRFQVDYDPHRKIRFRSRLELNSFDKNGRLLSGPEKIGTLMYQDFRWQPHASFSVHTRWTLFDAPSYDVRFYQFENDLPGLMRLKMLSGRGKRWYVLCTVKINKRCKASLKYENLYVDDKKTIGSGNDMLFSPFENIVSFQLDWQF
jgi:hypothetical protein